MKNEDIAKVAHEINRAYCNAIGDNTQLPWAECPKWQTDSALDGVVYHTNNPDSKPSDSHESWLRHKKDDGWVYGAEKDVNKKTHPCFVPYNDLPESQKIKDYLFIAVVKTIIDIG